MTQAAEHISLTDALTLAAFGVEVPSSDFAAEMNVKHFGMSRLEAMGKFHDALARLHQSALVGDLELIGLFDPGTNARSTELSRRIEPHALHDFGAFDYEINGLRHGPVQLLWFENDDSFYVQPVFSRPEYYRNIKVGRGQVRRSLGAGKSPLKQARSRPPLPEADLRNWYSGLPLSEQSLPIDKLFNCATESHPAFHVSRSRVRQIGGPRARGRPKSAVKKSAD